MSNVSVIGSGISGLSAACYIAANGHDVSVFEKNNTIGGRARQYSEAGFVFDMGPSWYWMPDVFENFFSGLGKSTKDYYDLVQLDPGFRMYFGKDDTIEIPANIISLYGVFETIEKGSSKNLKEYLAQARFKYEEGMLKLAFKPSLSFTEYTDPMMLYKAFSLDMFSSVSKHVRKYFKNERLIALMEFPVLFLGAMPWQIPALYSMMNYAALELGTWYPMGGMYKIIEGMYNLATSFGVKFYTSCEVNNIKVSNRKAVSISTRMGDYTNDVVVGACDYQHLEQKLLGIEHRNYDEKYWGKKTFAPSCLIFYLGVNKKIENIVHHNLFFDTDLTAHAKDIYELPKWPEAPLFYVCCPSKTDTSVAPEGHENLFVLMPIAAGLNDDLAKHEHYYELMMDRMEKITGSQIRQHVIYKRAYSVDNFITDYHAYKGNAYGLANTLRQTAFLKPTMKNKKIDNLFYAGQLTVPGPGLPPSLMSGQIAATLTMKYLEKNERKKNI